MRNFKSCCHLKVVDRVTTVVRHSTACYCKHLFHRASLTESATTVVLVSSRIWQVCDPRDTCRAACGAEGVRASLLHCGLLLT